MEKKEKNLRCMQVAKKKEKKLPDMRAAISRFFLDARLI